MWKEKGHLNQHAVKYAGTLPKKEGCVKYMRTERRLLTEGLPAEKLSQKTIIMTAYGTDRIPETEKKIGVRKQVLHARTAGHPNIFLPNVLTIRPERRSRNVRPSDAGKHQEPEKKMQGERPENAVRRPLR